MVRRYKYFERNVVPALLYTLSEDYENQFENEITYASGEFRYRYHPEWVKLPDELWGNVIRGVACDSEGCLYFTMRCKEAPIGKADQEGRLIGTFGRELPFERLHGISVAEDGTIWVADDMNHAVFQLDPDGKLLKTIGHPGVPADTLPFNKPTKLVPHSCGLFASDGYGNSSVHVFDRDGNLLRSWGAPGEKAGEFDAVHSVLIDEKKRVWVCDRNNDRVQIFSMDGQILKILEDLWNPVDVWSDGVYVYVLQNEGCISIYDMDYRLAAELGHWQCGNLIAHSFTGDDKGNLYLADCGVKGIIKLEKL